MWTWGQACLDRNSLEPRGAGARAGRVQGYLTYKKPPPLGPYRRPVHGVLRGSLGGGRFLMGEIPLYHDHKNHGETHDGPGPEPTKYDFIPIPTNERCSAKHQGGGTAGGRCEFDVRCCLLSHHAGCTPSLALCDLTSTYGQLKT